MNAREIFALAPIVALIVWIGVYPQFFIDRMAPSVAQIAGTLEQSRQRLAARAASAGAPVTPKPASPPATELASEE